MNNKWQRIQLAIFAIVGLYFLITGAGFSAFYGGLISLLNTMLINYSINKQTRNTTISAGIGMMWMSVIMRMIVVAGLTLVGLLLLKLNSVGLIIGLALTQIGFLIDNIKQK